MTPTQDINAAIEWPEISQAQYAAAVGNGYTEEQAARQLEGARLETDFRKGIELCRTPTRLKLSLALVAYSEGLALPPMSRLQREKFNRFARPYGDWLKANGGTFKDYGK